MDHVSEPFDGTSNLIPAKKGEIRNRRGRNAPDYTVASYIRAKTLNGRTLVNFLVKVFTGEESKFTKIADRLVAVRLLLDRGWGQAPQTLNLDAGDGKGPVFDMSALTNAELAAFKLILSKMAVSGGNGDSIEISQVDDFNDVQQASTDGPVPPNSPASDPNIKP